MIKYIKFILLSECFVETVGGTNEIITENCNY